jgi:hypothetical protein
LRNGFPSTDTTCRQTIRGGTLQHINILYEPLAAVVSMQIINVLTRISLIGAVCSALLLANASPSSASKQLRKLTAAAVTSLSLSFQTIMPLPVHGVDGPVPKMEFFRAETEVKVGEVLYDGAEKAMLLQKLDSLSPKFEKMISRVEAAIRKGMQQEAKSVLSSAMGGLKLDMRFLSKAASNGDILLRGSIGVSGQAEAEFNYNSGQFALQPIAALAEKIIDSVNDLYFNGLEGATDSDLASVSTLRKLFSEWEAIVRQKNNR